MLFRSAAHLCVLVLPTLWWQSVHAVRQKGFVSVGAAQPKTVLSRNESGNASQWHQSSLRGSVSEMSSTNNGSFMSHGVASKERHGSTTILTSSGSARVHFLFLTKDGVKNPDLWQAFFAGGNQKQYRSFLHCKYPGLCKNPLGLTMVETVSTEYCTDLVSAMVQLLRFAAADGTNARDKFAFVSETTLPVKPFPVIYAALTQNEHSNFCVKSFRTWGQTTGGVAVKLIKHSQWVVLNRSHAHTMIQGWPRVKTVHGWVVPRWSSNSTLTRNSNYPTVQTGQVIQQDPYTHKKWPLCADEWAFMATIYGAVPAATSDVMKEVRSIDGGCSTFAVWNDNTDLVQDLRRLHPYTRLKFSKGSSPAEFIAISDEGAEALRRSSFLFARKFDEHVMMLYQYKQSILSPT